MLGVMRHQWEHLLFAHWPINPEVMQAQLPPSLVADTFEGQAWLAVVPFQLTFWPRGLPTLPVFGRRFTELNLRTYVRPANQPQAAAGVYFFALDASDRLSVEMARLAYHLAYRNAKSYLTHSNDDWWAFHSQRTDSRGLPAEVQVRYRPTATPLPAEQQPLARWLTERYRLYSVNQQNQVWTAQLQHQAWELQAAEAEWTLNTLPQAHGFEIEGLQPPVLHYAQRMDVLAGLPYLL